MQSWGVAKPPQLKESPVESGTSLRLTNLGFPQIALVSDFGKMGKRTHPEHDCSFKCWEDKMVHLSFSACLIGVSPHGRFAFPYFRNLNTDAIREKLRLGFPKWKRSLPSANFFLLGNPNLSFSQIWPVFKFRKSGKRPAGGRKSR